MNKATFITELNKYLDPESPISATLYFLLEIEGELELRKVDIETSLQLRIADQFKEYINSRFIENEDLSYLKLSEYDDRKNVIYHYDYETQIEKLDFLQDVVSDENIETFSFSNDSLDDLFGYVTLIGNESNQLSIFKKHHPIDFVKRDRRLYIFPADERFEELDMDGFILNKGFDVLRLNDSILVNNSKVLEKYFGFEKVITQESDASLVLIETKGFVEDMEDLKAYAESNIAYRRKLMKSKTSPVLNMDFNKVSSFVSTHTKLHGILKRNDSNTSFNLSSANAKKEFLKLLNDDYLNSDLTDIEYATRSKDKLD